MNTVIDPKDNHYLPKRDIIERLSEKSQMLAFGFCIGNTMKYGTRDREDKDLGADLDKLFFFVSSAKKIAENNGFKSFKDVMDYCNENDFC